MVNSGLLLMAVMGLMFPAVLQATHTERDGQSSELQLSRFSSFVMLFAYCCYLYFQLVTHTHLYDEDNSVRGPPEYFSHPRSVAFRLPPLVVLTAVFEKVL